MSQLNPREIRKNAFYVYIFHIFGFFLLGFSLRGYMYQVMWGSCLFELWFFLVLKITSIESKWFKFYWAQSTISPKSILFIWSSFNFHSIYSNCWLLRCCKIYSGEAGGKLVQPPMSTSSASALLIHGWSSNLAQNRFADFSDLLSLI